MANPVEIKLYMCQPSAKDVKEQRVRFMSHTSQRIRHWLDPVILRSRNDWMALPRICGKHDTVGVIGMPWPEPLQVGEYPLFAVAQRVIADYLAGARKCECGSPKRWTYQKCADCHDAMMRGVIAGSDTGPREYYEPKRRTLDHRENTRETKYGE